MTSENDAVAARQGDVVTIDFALTPENDFVPYPLFDTHGTVAFVLGWGNYLPGLHALVEGMRPGDAVVDVSIDAGYGERSPDLVAQVRKDVLLKKLEMDTIQIGAELCLGGDVNVTVTELTDEHVTLDANAPLAGSSYACTLKVLAVEFAPSSFEYHGDGAADVSHEENEDVPTGALSESSNDLRRSRYRVATFALGCFWGGELAYLRTPGVVGTRVGYTQGIVAHPTYDEVCAGKTMHREAILVVYDPSIVPYEQLVMIALERSEDLLLSSSSSSYMINTLFEEEGEEEEAGRQQYQHGIYYHTESQRRTADYLLKKHVGDRRFELSPAKTFYHAEEWHQQYLLKGGQSARKNEKEPIRCYG